MPKREPSAPQREVLGKPFIFTHEGTEHEIYDAVLADAIQQRDKLLRAFVEGVDKLIAGAALDDATQRRAESAGAIERLVQTRRQIA